MKISRGLFRIRRSMSRIVQSPRTLNLIEPLFLKWFSFTETLDSSSLLSPYDPFRCMCAMTIESKDNVTLVEDDWMIRSSWSLLENGNFWRHRNRLLLESNQRFVGLRIFPRPIGELELSDSYPFLARNATRSWKLN